MAITVNWPSKVIFVPKSFLTWIGPGEVYELDIDVFRLALKSLEDDEVGIAYEDTHRHNTAVTVGSVTLARVVEIINGYTVTFEDGQYAVNFKGANTNVADVTNVNQVSVRPNNAAGLVDPNVFGALAALLSAWGWTAQRALKLDNLDATVSSAVSAVTPLETTAGEILGTVNTVVSNVGDVLSGLNVLTGSVGQVQVSQGVQRALLNENTYTDQHVYDAAVPPQLLSARVRAYNTRANAEAHGDTGLLQTFLMTAAYDAGGKLITYTYVRVGS